MRETRRQTRRGTTKRCTKEELGELALLTEEDEASRVKLLSRNKKTQNAKAYRKRVTTSLKAKLKSAQKVS